MGGGDIPQGRLVDPVGRHDRYANRRLRPDRRRPLATFEQRALAEQGAGTDLGDGVAVDLDVTTPSRSRKSSPPSSPSLTSASPCSRLRRSSSLPSRMIEAESSRSSP